MRLFRSRPTLVLVSITMAGALAACGGSTGKDAGASSGGGATSVEIKGVVTGVGVTGEELR